MGKIKDKKWFQAVMKIAPAIATAAGGPFGGLAATVLKEITGLDEAGVEQAIAEGDPEIFLKLKEAEKAFEIEMERFEIKREELAFGDIADSRRRQMEMKDNTPAILTAVALTFFFALAASVLYNLDIVKESESFIMFLFGSASSWVTQGMSYFLGSSRGSEHKTNLLAASEPSK